MFRRKIMHDTDGLPVRHGVFPTATGAVDAIDRMGRHDHNPYAGSSVLSKSPTRQLSSVSDSTISFRNLGHLWRCK